MSDKKPREFWISELTKDYGNTVYCLKHKVDEYIHVIEKSAYDEALTQADKLAELLEDIAPSWLPSGPRLRRNQVLIEYHKFRGKDEFDEKAARRGYVEHFDNHPLDSRLRDPESAWAVACRWQFNQMKRAPVVNEDAERDRLAEEYARSSNAYYKVRVLSRFNNFVAGWNARPVRSVKDASAMLKQVRALLLEELKDIGNCNCGFEEPMGEGYTDGTCRLHEALQIIAAFKGEL